MDGSFRLRKQSIALPPQPATRIKSAVGRQGARATKCTERTTNDGGRTTKDSAPHRPAELPGVQVLDRPDHLAEEKDDPTESVLRTGKVEVGVTTSASIGFVLAINVTLPLTTSALLLHRVAMLLLVQFLL